MGRTVSTALIAENGRLTLQLKLGEDSPPLSFEVRTTRTHLSYPLATGFLAEARRAGALRVLFAPYVPGPSGHRLVSSGLSYVDAVGNCHIEVGERLIAHVEGKKAVRKATVRVRGTASYQLLFALLAQPDLAEAPVRTVALAAGIGKSAALEQLGHLNTQGLLDYHPAMGLGRRRELLDRWLTAYAESVRPSWLVARYRSPVTDPQALEALIEGVFGSSVWAFGGSAAAHRMLSSDRGPETVLHVAEVPLDLAEQLQAIPAADGPLTILRTPGALAYRGVKPHLAHPLLVYTELLNSSEPQALRAANTLREQFLAI